MNMKLIKSITPAVLAAAIALSGCSKKFEEYERNPNRAESVSPDLVFRGVTFDMNQDDPWNDITRWNQFDACNYSYYGDQRYDWGSASLNFTTLKNVVKMEEEAIGRGMDAVNPYAAIGKFHRAFFYYRMTNLVGDLPMDEALKGLENTRPVYNTQKEIFVQMLKWLEDSNTELTQLIASGNLLLDGDIYYSNNLRKWQKAVNAFQLRVLIALSKKEADADLNIKGKMNEIYSNPTKYPLFSSMDDNLQFMYNNINKYPSNPDNLGFDATRYNMSATYLNNLVTINDPRVFIVAEPATKQLKNGKTPANITAYVGAPSGEDLADMSSKMSSVDDADYSLRSRARYYSSYAPEPGVIIGYAEMCFNIAEGINRGWITSGDAEEWYMKGIKASLGFYGIPVNEAGAVSKTYEGVNYVIPFDFNESYYPQAAVKYKGNNADGLTQILTQKYFAFFQNSGWEAFFNWRRTGVPTFSVGVGTGNSGAIPKRFQYPTDERTTNADNYQAAVSSQYGTDDINQAMWLIK